jgi:hypothetical protein
MYKSAAFNAKEMKKGRQAAFFLLPADYLALGLNHER